MEWRDLAVKAVEKALGEVWDALRDLTSPTYPSTDVPEVKEWEVLGDVRIDLEDGTVVAPNGVEERLFYFRVRAAKAVCQVAKYEPRRVLEAVENIRRLAAHLRALAAARRAEAAEILKIQEHHVCILQDYLNQ